MMSAVQTKLSGVFRFSLSLAVGPALRGDRTEVDSCSPWTAHRAPANVVSNGTCLPFSSKPLTWPKLRRKVNVASG